MAYQPPFDGNGRTGRLWHTLLLSRWRPVLAWLPVESTIRQRQADYYAAHAKSDAVGSSEVFVELMLEVIRDSILPFSKSIDERDAMKARALEFFRANPDATIDQLADCLGCSKRSAERAVSELKRGGALLREGSARWEVDRALAAGLQLGYLFAMERSPVRDVEMKTLLKASLTDEVDERQVYLKGIDASCRLTAAGTCPAPGRARAGASPSARRRTCRAP